MYDVSEVIDMNMREYIKLCCVKRDITEAELARRMGQTPKNLNHQPKRNTLTVSEPEKIAEALGATLSVSFIDNETGKPII